MIIDFFNIHDHSIIDIDLAQFGGSALTDQIDVPKKRDLSDMDEIPVTYVLQGTLFFYLWDWLGQRCLGHLIFLLE
ncbi:hypothetical protein Ct9H90mP29_00220 [bacterium]|nr:MAG: hypothetical protein Ct9H90mP29_00220 [bacterium]